MADFDPGGVAKKGNLFGFPYDMVDADLVVIPMPWDVTASYGDGASYGPKAILDASDQLDFSIPGLIAPWTFKTVLAPEDSDLRDLNEKTRPIAKRVISAWEQGIRPSQVDIDKVNAACEQMIQTGIRLAEELISRQVKVAFVGGDHSTPLGLLTVLAREHQFGILQIDAHMDLRAGYEGFKYSHASIMYNALLLSNITTLTQVGIRDFAEEEVEYASRSSKDVNVFYDEAISRRLFQGTSWSHIVTEIVASLPSKVYVSVDIDGLEPSNCPNTGTPVPGGLTYSQVIYLLQELANSGKQIIGFDLSEVCPGQDDWDGNVGARVLYRLATCMGISCGAIKGSEGNL